MLIVEDPAEGDDLQNQYLDYQKGAGDPVSGDPPATPADTRQDEVLGASTPLPEGSGLGSTGPTHILGPRWSSPPAAGGGTA